MHKRLPHEFHMLAFEQIKEYMKKKYMIIICIPILMLSCLVAGVFIGKAIYDKDEISFYGEIIKKLENQNQETDAAEDTDENFNTRSCMIDETGNLLVMNKDGYEPYNYDRFPGIPKNLSRIIKVLRDSNNIVTL